MHATIHGTPIAYQEAGQGPAILLLHDLPLCRSMWQPQITTLSHQGYRVIAPDLRGCGESQLCGQPLSLRMWARDILTLMNYLGIGRAVMVGSGLACGVITEIIKRHPHRVAAASLLSPNHVPVGADNVIQCGDLAELIREGHRSVAVDILCDKLLPESCTLHSQQLSLQIQRWIDRVETTTLAKILTLSCPEFRLQTKIPVQVIQGDRGVRQPQVDPGMAINVETIPGAGHLVNLEQSARVNRSLLHFLSWLNLVKPRHYRHGLAA